MFLCCSSASYALEANSDNCPNQTIASIYNTFIQIGATAQYASVLQSANNAFNQLSTNDSCLLNRLYLYQKMADIYADGYNANKDYVKAEQYYIAAENLIVSNAADDISLYETTSNLAQFYLRTGQLAKAQETFARCDQELKKIIKPNNPVLYAKLISEIGRYYLLAKQQPTALAWYAQALKELKILMNTHPETVADAFDGIADDWDFYDNTQHTEEFKKSIDGLRSASTNLRGKIAY